MPNLRISVRKVAALFLASIFALFVGSLFLSYRLDLCAKDEFSGLKECVPYHLGPFFVNYVVRLLDDHGSSLAAIATCVIAAFTISLVSSTNKLWEAGERESAMSGPFLEPVLEHDPAQYKAFEWFDHPTSPVNPVHAEVSFSLRNIGNSPALLRMVAAETVHHSRMVDSPRLDFAGDYAVEPVIEAGKTSHQKFSRQLTVPIDKDGYSSIKSGRSFVFLYGEIVFSDLLGEDYNQKFCFYYNFKSRGFVRYEGQYNRRIKLRE
jgi:hypothetical protein